MSGPAQADLAAVVVRLLRAVDLRDWTAVASHLADEVSLDYTSVFGGEPERLPSAQIVARWSGQLPGFDATQHFVGALLETEAGVLEGNVRGYHHLEAQTWMVAGWYRISIRRTSGGVRIDAITLVKAYEEGSRELLERAQRRAAD